MESEISWLLSKTHQWLTIVLRIISIFFPWLIKSNMIQPLSTFDFLPKFFWLCCSSSNTVQSRGFSLFTPLPECFFSDIHCIYSLTSFKPLLHCYHFRDIFTNHSIWNRSPPQSLSSLIYYFIFILWIFHSLIIFDSLIVFASLHHWNVISV